MSGRGWRVYLAQILAIDRIQRLRIRTIYWHGVFRADPATLLATADSEEIALTRYSHESKNIGGLVTNCRIVFSFSLARPSAQRISFFAFMAYFLLI
jgi:hypothetical protein